MPFQTENKNFQSQLNFEFTIHRIPDVAFNLQRIVLPGVEITPIKVPSVVNKFHVPGDEVVYGQLEVEFKVQEGMRDWYEIFQWVTSLAFPETHDQYANIRRGRLKNLDGKNVPLQDPNPDGGRKLQNLFSDITLHILTSKENPYLEFTFKDAFPVSLGPLTFNTTDADVNYLSSSIRFQYDTYNVRKP